MEPPSPEVMAEIRKTYVNMIINMKPDKLVTDHEGHTVRMMEFEGTNYPTFPDVGERIGNLPTFEVRDDDVILAAYPKCGTHWIYEVLKMLGSANDTVIKGSKEEFFLEAMDRQMMEFHPSPRFLNTHLIPKYLPTSAIKKKTKIVFMIRNVKDAAVSFYNHWKHLKFIYAYEGTFTGFIKLFMDGNVDFGGWFEYMQEWDKFIKANPDYPILVLFFEDMKEDSAQSIRALAEFLGFACDEERSKIIAEATSFKKLKESKTSSGGMGDMEYHEASKSAIVGLYRKGEVGDWKNWFTVAQNERMDAMYSEKMKDSSFNVRFVI